MPIVTGVRLRYSKTLWFDPGELSPQEGDIVIVETERGQEVGLVQHGPHEVEERALKAPLKPVVRIATEEDMRHVVELGEKEKEAMPKFKELIERNKLDMKPVDIEYLFSGDKIVFYFSAEERVDFRTLVKDLAAHFHTRIDMRQVGVRDEARMVGGLGHCGEVLCCARMGGEFNPVSIKMAKDQGLPLNPLKISGRCGRLMCCLRYEVEAYQDFNARSPRKNASVDTPRGVGKVVDIDALREIITLQFEESEDEGPDKLAVPLCKMHCEKEGKKCNCSVSEEVFKELTEEKEHPVDTFFFPTPTFKNLDKKGAQDLEQSSSTPAEQKSEKKGGSKQDSSRRKRNRKTNKSQEQTSEKNDVGQARPSRRRRRGGRNKQSQSENAVQSSEKKQQNTHQSRKQRSSEGKHDSVHAAELGQRVPRRRNRSKSE